MCHVHWFNVPKHLRDELWAGYRAGVLSPKYVAAHHGIQEWLKQNHPEHISEE